MTQFGLHCTGQRIPLPATAPEGSEPNGSHDFLGVLKFFCHEAIFFQDPKLVIDIMGINRYKSPKKNKIESKVESRGSKRPFPGPPCFHSRSSLWSQSLGTLLANKCKLFFLRVRLCLQDKIVQLHILPALLSGAVPRFLFGATRV